jgi:ribosome-binding factor A
MKKQQTNSNRGERVASKVKTIVSTILRDIYYEDNILSGVSLVGTQSGGGMQFIKLFYYTRNEDKKLVQKRLDDITKTIRFELASRIDQKYVPDIRFVYDDTMERASRIDELLANIN